MQHKKVFVISPAASTENVTEIEGIQGLIIPFTGYKVLGGLLSTLPVEVTAVENKGIWTQ